MSTAAQAAAYRASHRQQVAARTATYRAAHREEERARTAAWITANPERHRKASREYARVHSAELTAKRREAKRAYYLANRELFAARRREWQRANPEKTRAYSSKWRAQKLGVGGSHTGVEFLEKCAIFGNACFYCGAVRPLEEDHLVPLSRGGSDAIWNVVPACRSCNARKHNKTAEEFLALKAVA